MADGAGDVSAPPPVPREKTELEEVQMQMNVATDEVGTPLPQPLGAIQVLRNSSFFLEISPPPHPLVTLITLNRTPS